MFYLLLPFLLCFLTFFSQAKHFSINVYKKEDKDLKAKNERLAERREAFRAGELEQDLSELKMRPEPFTWEGLVGMHCSQLR